MPVVEREVTVLNAHGLHVRPATRFAEEAEKYHSEVIVSREGNPVNGKAIIELLTLAATAGSVLRIRCEGPDADKAADALAALVASKFGIE